MFICMYIYIYICIYTKQRLFLLFSAQAGRRHAAWEAAFTRYCHCQCCMVYGIHKGVRLGGRILRNCRAIVLQQGRLCRWGAATKGGFTPTIKL